MKKAINTFMFHEWELEEVLQLCSECRIDYVGLCMDHVKNSAQTCKLLKEWKIQAIGLYVLFISTEHPYIESEEKAAIIDAFQKAAQIESPYITIIFKRCEKDDNYKNLLKIGEDLAILSKKYQIKILLEAMHPKYRNFSAICYSAEMLFLDQYLDEECFGWVLDICHLGEENIWKDLPKEFVNHVKCIHLANLDGDDIDERCFPQYGIYQWREIANILRRKGFDGYIELEVISSEISKMEKEEIKSEICSALREEISIIGELALHQFIAVEEESYTTAEETRQIGGGAAMILRQLHQLGIAARSLTISGDDALGNELGQKIAGYSSPNIHINAKKARTSHVKIYINKSGCIGMDIVVGTAIPECLIDYIDEFCISDSICYCPYFPGYESIARKLSDYPGQKLILDFGYFEWCGKVEKIMEQLKEAPEGIYMALINGKNMMDKEKKLILEACRLKGYKKMVLTDGIHKLWAYEGEKKFCFMPKAMTEICTCGAGDVLIAGIMTQMARNASLEEAVRYGAELSAAKVQKLGI